MPSNLPVLLRNIDVDVTLANDPANQVSGYLVAPGGETMGYGSSYLTTGFTGSGVPVESPQRQLSLYASDPIPGVWTLIIDFTSPVPGNELADPFTGRVRFNAVSLQPGSAARLAVGHAPAREAGDVPDHGAQHRGGAAEDIFLDPRLTTLRSYPLQPQDQVAGVRLPVPANGEPARVDRADDDAQRVGVGVTSSVPVMFDFGPFPGDPTRRARPGARPPPPTRSAGRSRRSPRGSGSPCPPRSGRIPRAAPRPRPSRPPCRR